ncbi:hypothetical protein CW368_03010 [Actinomycetales bacterium SN12]|nr:hypothetical protein CW368_03010 [Actinomycetales bacterium SN12]
MIAKAIASKMVSEMTSAFNAASATIIVTALTIVARRSAPSSCHSRTRCESSRKAKDSTAPLVARSWAIGSTERG